WIPHPEFDHIPETQIFVAEVEGEILGSISVTQDGMRGMPIDTEFPRTSMITRSQGRRLAQVWRFLVRDSGTLKDTVICHLLSAAVNHMQVQHMEIAFLCVPEEQASACQDYMKAVPLTRLRSARGLSAAMSLLLRADLTQLQCY